MPGSVPTRFRKTEAAVKLHTLFDVQGNIPAFIHITDGKLHDVNVLDIMASAPGAFYIMDRAYLDFARLHTLHLNGAHFMLRSKKITKLQRLSSRKVNRSTGVICDQVLSDRCCSPVACLFVTGLSLFTLSVGSVCAFSPGRTTSCRTITDVRLPATADRQ